MIQQQKPGASKFSKTNYHEAINFALNYPPDFDLIRYHEEKDVFIVSVFDEGWYNVNLTGSFVRACLKWKGVRKWKTNE